MAGINGERSGLWFEFARIIRELRPRVVIVENVSALLIRGMDVVLRDLAACGFDAEWQCIPAGAVGAPHVRDRVFIIAYADSVLGDARNGIFKHDNKQNEIQSSRYDQHACAHRWTLESAPIASGMDDGVFNGVQRLSALGNAVVPQVAELIGRRVMYVMNS
jgi:DNA (cytosine-5)-methyltransferase 1